MDNISLNQKANFAIASRLLASVINEGIVNAIFQSNHNTPNNVTESKKSGEMIVLPNFEKTYFNNENCIISIPTLHKPITSAFIQRLDKVELIDPWDINYPINIIKFKEPLSFRNGDIESSMKFIFSSLNSNDSIEAISPVELMRIFGAWMKLDDDIVKQVNAELDSSVQYQAYTYKNHNHQLSLLSSSIEWEQSLLEGHATHPMNKARLAITPIPEILPGTYDFTSPLIRFVEVPLDKMVIRGSYIKTIEKILKLTSSSPPTPSENTIIMPVHELQIPNIISRFPFVKILPGKYFIKAKSQASLRTVIIPNLDDIAIKLTLGIKVTSALRTITPWTVHSGTGLGNVLDKLEIDRNLLKVCKEFAGVYPIEENYDIAKHLSCIIREDFNGQNSDGESVIVCSALTERDEFGKSVVERVCNLDTLQKRVDFLNRYVHILFKAFLPAVLVNGFSFESHLQNVLARFDSKSGQLVGFVVRDYGGIKHHQDTLFASIGERANVLKDNVTEAKDLIEVYDLLYHTLILCHVHRFVRALHLHYNGIGWDIVRKHFKQIVPKDHLLYKTFLEQDKINNKCFIRMKCDGLYRDDEPIETDYDYDYDYSF
ncbi:487_t:CDS:2 [Funneliformis geosporum]|uniref:12668_t:CDS:1 n=1 Tax=Funneliformis geosporum TaxID=1117311 RepID=A0A9W4SEA5_9GLOM|nr:12668_t:CDS:2 [Funneliformis geosporum]CAI2167031.1 487_t:CDS:2 [Funneliformis geosporum]